MDLTIYPLYTGQAPHETPAHQGCLDPLNVEAVIIPDVNADSQVSGYIGGLRELIDNGEYHPSDGHYLILSTSGVMIIGQVVVIKDRKVEALPMHINNAPRLHTWPPKKS